jgi:secreted PhoX family phosphatase
MPLARRQFISRAAALGAGFLGLHSLLEGGADEAPNPAWSADGYGPLRPDPNKLLDLPDGFSYRVFSRAGETMSDGLIVPGAHDGMAAFSAPGGKTILVRNHELLPAAAERGAFGENNANLSAVDSKYFYDHGRGSTPCLGGTTTLVYDTQSQQLERHWLSLTGTIRNCAGGPTPWGSWISCEETNIRKQAALERDHGYNFEVPAAARGPVQPIPLEAMGRFNHEAIAVHQPSGIVYQTEDRGDGLFYRFLPNKPGSLAKGGRLQALALADSASADTRNWRTAQLRQGEPLPVRWIDIRNPRSPKDDLRKQGADNGAARFARGEGIWASGDDIYFACTDGGARRAGQVFRYRVGAAEGTKQEARTPSTLELFLESPDRRVLEYCDNLTVAPWGDLVLCEDGDGVDHVIGVTPDAKVYRLARNARDDGEFAGSTFSPDGSTLFVNIQSPGLTLAITGPWSRRAA